MSDFFINSFNVEPPFPTVSGGTLTSDATYYYRTFTNTSTTGATTDTLTISGKPLTFDYLLVGGGGSVPSSPFLVGTYYGNIYGVGSGGAGGVLSGSTTLNPNSYSIRLGGVGSGKLKGYDSYAFNDLLRARGGGSGGSASSWSQPEAPLDSATNEQGTYPQGTTNNIVGSGGGYPTAGTGIGYRQYPHYGQGTMGGFQDIPGSYSFNPDWWYTIKARVEANYPGYTMGQNYSCATLFDYGYLLNTPSGGCIDTIVSGGGAGAAGYGLHGQGYAVAWYENNPTYYRTGWETRTTSPTSGFVFTGSNYAPSNAAGAGVTILGLTVGQNGDLPIFRRTSALTAANTGCGSGFTHGPGTGVLRIRYLRSAVGG